MDPSYGTEPLNFRTPVKSNDFASQNSFLSLRSAHITPLLAPKTTKFRVISVGIIVSIRNGWGDSEHVYIPYIALNHRRLPPSISWDL